ncbi:MAG TPA: M56 family metallopeptidase [Terriglobales bacterium]|nr:M56 family metallopeptidase [Terriglobales bacterium]
MMGPETINAIAQMSAERLLASLLEGSALAAFAWALLRVWPRPNAATRFAVWFSALLATALLPWVSGWSAPAAPVSRTSLISVPERWALYVAGAWMVVALISLARVVYGYLQLRRLRRSCRVVESDELDPAAAACFAAAPSRRKVQLLSSPETEVPTAIGFLHPAVIMPERLLKELSPQDLGQVLLHEMAHLRRCDDWTNALQQVVKAIFCFHPAVWWVERRISLEREMACDDAVLAATSSPRAYAECLARLAENSVLRRGISLAQAAVGRMRQLTARVTRILDADRPSPSGPRKWAVSVVGSFAVICAAVAWHAPRLVSFAAPATEAHRYAPADGVVGREIYAPAIAASYVPDASRAHLTVARQAEPATSAGKPAAKPRAAVTPRVKSKRPAERRSVLQAKAAAPQPARVVMVYFVQAHDAASGATWQMCVWTVVAPQPVRKSI